MDNIDEGWHKDWAKSLVYMKNWEPNKRWPLEKNENVVALAKLERGRLHRCTSERWHVEWAKSLV